MSPLSCAPGWPDGRAELLAQDYLGLVRELREQAAGRSRASLSSRRRNPGRLVRARAVACDFVPLDLGQARRRAGAN
jgi:hypothetical protein